MDTMRLKWMLFGVALLQVCVLWNQFFDGSDWSLLSLPVALIGVVLVLCNLILMGLEEKKE